MQNLPLRPFLPAALGLALALAQVCAEVLLLTHGEVVVATTGESHPSLPVGEVLLAGSGMHHATVMLDAVGFPIVVSEPCGLLLD